MNTELIKKIQQCPNLPSLPAIAVQVLELAGKPDVDIAEIARGISKDPALSGKILRTVNSSFYGRSQHVGTDGGCGFEEVGERPTGVDVLAGGLPGREDDPKRRCPDITRAKTLLNWNPQIQLEEGLKRTLEYFKAQ